MIMVTVVVVTVVVVTVVVVIATGSETENTCENKSLEAKAEYHGCIFRRR